MPRYCIVTGGSTRLIRREKTCWPLGRRGAGVLLALLFGLPFLVVVLGVLAGESIVSWWLMAVPISLAGCGVVLMVRPPRRCCIPVRIVWYVSQTYLNRVQRRKKWCVAGSVLCVLTSIVGVVSLQIIIMSGGLAENPEIGEPVSRLALAWLLVSVAALTGAAACVDGLTVPTPVVGFRWRLTVGARLIANSPAPFAVIGFSEAFERACHSFETTDRRVRLLRRIDIDV